MIEVLRRRRQWFDAFAERVEENLSRLDALTPAPMTPGPIGQRRRFKQQAFHSCPCCGYGTLASRGDYEICVLCHWEDDGQDDADADIVRGGPNGSYSLTEARQNFTRHLVQYSGADLARVLAEPLHEERTRLKRELIATYDRMPAMAEADLPAAWQRVRETKAAFAALLKRAMPRTP